MARQAGIYVRISADPTGRRLGVTRQLEDCRKRAKQLDWAIVEVFEDNDVSASTGKPRPAYLRMLDSIRAGKITAVVVWDLDRLTRRPIEIEEFIELADKHGVALASVGGEVDLSTDNGRLFARIKGAVARSEIERKGARQKAANAQRRAQGRPHGGGRRAFGYSPDGMTIVESEASAIRSAAESLLAGASMYEIARSFNERGLLTSVGNQWKPTEARRMLANPRNAALIAHKGEVVGPGSWPAILDEDTYLAVRAELRDPDRHKAGRPREYLLSGVLECAVCGLPVFGGFEKRKQYAVYRCPSRAHISRRVDELDAYVSAVVLERLSRPDAVRLFAKPGVADRAAELRREELALRARLDSLAAAFADGDIDRRQLRAGTDRLRGQIDAVVAELAQSGSAPDITDVLAAGDLAEAWLEIPMPRRRQILRLLMVIKVHPAGQGARSFRPETIDIEWKK